MVAWIRRQQGGGIMMEAMEAECVACGEFIDYCQGHGELGDPVGFATLLAHDDGEHSACVWGVDCDE